MPMSIGIRSLWIGLRAVNYTAQAFREVGEQVTDLVRKQQILQRQSMQMVQAGTLFIALGAMITMGLTQAMRASETGAKVMEKFDAQMAKVSARFGESLTKILAPALQTLANVLDIISQNKALMTIISVLVIMIPIVLIFVGALLLVKGAMSMVTLATAVMNGILKIFGLTTQVTTHQVNMLALAIGAAFAVFTLLFTLKDIIGPVGATIIAVLVAITAAFWALFVAESAATFGIALAIGGAAAAAAIAIQATSSSEGYQTGTRMLTRTGRFTGHAGEVIWNPRTGMPTSVNNDMNRGATKREFNITISTGDIHTKADKEELLPFIKRALRDELDNKD